MKKKFDTSTIENKLREGSVFFQREHLPTPVPPIATKKRQEEIRQTSKSESKQASKEDNQNASLLANQKTSKEEKKIASNKLKKFGSYLDFDVYKRMKRLAIEEEKPDYIILQEALDTYLKSKGY